MYRLFFQIQLADRVILAIGDIELIARQRHALRIAKRRRVKRRGKVMGKARPQIGRVFGHPAGHAVFQKQVVERIDAPWKRLNAAAAPDDSVHAVKGDGAFLQLSMNQGTAIRQLLGYVFERFELPGVVGHVDREYFLAVLEKGDFG